MDAKDAENLVKAKTNEQSIIALEERVNYDKLMAYIQQTHPTEEIFNEAYADKKDEDGQPEPQF